MAGSRPFKLGAGQCCLSDSAHSRQQSLALRAESGGGTAVAQRMPRPGRRLSRGAWPCPPTSPQSSHLRAQGNLRNQHGNIRDRDTRAGCGDKGRGQPHHGRPRPTSPAPVPPGCAGAKRRNIEPDCWGSNWTSGPIQRLRPPIATGPFRGSGALGPRDLTAEAQRPHTTDHF